MENLILYKNPDDNWKSEKINGRMVDIPMDWIIAKLGNKIIVKSGKANARDDEEGGLYPLYDRSEKIKKSNTYIFDNEALIFPGEGQNFIPKYFKGKYNLHQRAYCLTNFKDTNPFFMAKMLEMYKEDFLRLSVGSTVPSLRKPIFEEFDYIFPLITLEQTLIASILTDQENIISKLKSLKAKKQKMIKYFQQEELSGRLRLRLTQNSARYLLNKGILVSDGVTEVDASYPINDNSVLSIVSGKEQEFEDYLKDGFDSKVEFYLNGDDNWKSVKVNGRMVDIPYDFQMNHYYENIIMLKTPSKYKIQKNQILQEGKFPVFSQEKAMINGYCNDKSKLKKINDEKYILFGDHTTIFKKIDTDFIIGADGTQIFKPNENINFEFFYFLSINNLIKSDGYKRHFKLLKDKEVFFSESKIEQTLIATHLIKLDKEIEVLDAKIAKEEKVFTYLSQELLSGRLRVK